MPAMTTPDSQIEFFFDGEGLIAFGHEEALDELGRIDGFSISQVSPQILYRMRDVLSTVGEFQERSGRYVKVGPETAKLLKQRVTTGPVRGAFRRGDLGLAGNAGQLFKQIEIESLVRYTPAVATLGSSLVAQAAIEAALREIKDYLDSIESKLDELLRQKKVESLGELQGVANALNDAVDYYRENNNVSTTKWSTVSHLGATLHTLEATALGQISSLVEQLTASQDNSKKIADEFRKLDNELEHWLAYLAWSLYLHDQFYVLEIAHAREFEPDSLDAHHDSIQRRRDERIESVALHLLELNNSIRSAAELTADAWFTAKHPKRAGLVNAAANKAERAIQDFAHRADLNFEQRSQLETLSWKKAVSVVFDDSVKALDQGRQRGIEQIKEQINETHDRYRTHRQKKALKKSAKMVRRNAETKSLKSPATPAIEELLPQTQQGPHNVEPEHFSQKPEATEE